MIGQTDAELAASALATAEGLERKVKRRRAAADRALREAIAFEREAERFRRIADDLSA